MDARAAASLSRLDFTPQLQPRGSANAVTNVEQIYLSPLRMAAKKVVVIGPESTGKSTLCAALAGALDTVWVPEFARQFLDELGRPYEERDLLAIAAGQLLTEDSLASQARGVLLCDTDLHVLKTWSHERYGRCHHRILAGIAERHYDAYILTYPDLPWTPDPQREHPDPTDRIRLWHHYHDALQVTGLPWVDVRGSHKDRLCTALNFLHRLTDPSGA